MTVQRYALLSGFFGATASCIAKFALSSSSSQDDNSGFSIFSSLVESVCSESSIIEITKMTTTTTTRGEGLKTLLFRFLDTLINNPCPIVVEYIPRLLCFILAVVLNIVMVGSFLQGMEESGSIAGTGLSSASNFGFAALYGFVLYKEQFSLLWLLGFTLVVIGVLLLSTIQATTTSSSSSPPTSSSTETSVTVKTSTQLSKLQEKQTKFE